jgi:plasmid replication initiation protein
MVDRMKTTDSPLVTQANQIVEASYKLTLAEKRLVLLVLTKIDSHPDKPAALPETLIEVCACDVVEHIKLPQKKAYEMLKEASERLAERWVIIDRPDPRNPKLKQTRTRWVYTVNYIPDDGKLQLRLSVDILPYLTHLAGEFVRYRINQVSAMSSVYAIRLYELLVQWLKEGEREVEIEWLIEKFEIPESYRKMSNLKKRVIDPAIDQVNTHSNLNVTYTQRKRGRSVVSFIFEFGIKKQATKPVSQPTTKATPAPRRQYNKAMQQEQPAPQPPAFVPDPAPAKRTPEQNAKGLAGIGDALKAIKTAAEKRQTGST